MQRPKPISILVADDDPDDREMTRDAFDANLLRNPVAFVDDGEALLDYLNRTGPFADSEAAPLPGLILLDLNMPRKGGRETLAALKADPRLKHIPVVVLTTSKAEEDIARSYDLGASSFITKPVTFDSLVQVVGAFGKYWLEIVELPPASTT
jgi:CheY-like chemotaxis protein